MRQNLHRLQLQQWSFDAGADADADDGDDDDDDDDGSGGGGGDDDAKGIGGTVCRTEKKKRKTLAKKGATLTRKGINGTKRREMTIASVAGTELEVGEVGMEHARGDADAWIGVERAIRASPARLRVGQAREA